MEFLSALDAVDREKDHEAWVLLASAYAATYRRAGQTPPVSKPSLLPTPAPKESKPYCSPRVATRLANMVGEVGTYEPFLEEALIALARKGLIVPPAAVIDLLVWGRNNRHRRVLLIPVVGERGHWLTSQNPQWKNALQVDPTDPTTTQDQVAQAMSSQQALYDALNITDNIFSKTLSVFKGQGPSSNRRMIDQVMEKVLAMSTPGQKVVHMNERQLAKIAFTVPPVILPELVSRIRKAVATGDTTWLYRLGDLLEFRLQMLEELANE